MPPTSIEYFSNNRNPGVVFLVPAMIPWYPALRANSIVFVDCNAMPEHLQRMFNDSLSACKMFFTGPVTTATLILPDEVSTGFKCSPSSTNHSTANPHWS